MDQTVNEFKVQAIEKDRNQMTAAL
jgi:hypothetical protein